MSVRLLKPTSPGRRGQTVSTFEEITRARPERSLTTGKPENSGRNNFGRITSRRRGSGRSGGLVVAPTRDRQHSEHHQYE